MTRKATSPCCTVAACQPEIILPDLSAVDVIQAIAVYRGKAVGDGSLCSVARSASPATRRSGRTSGTGRIVRPGTIGIPRKFKNAEQGVRVAREVRRHKDMGFSMPLLRLPVVCSVLLSVCVRSWGDQSGAAPSAGSAKSSSEAKAQPAAEPTPPTGILNRMMQGTWPHAAGLRLSGYLDQGFTWNPWYPSDHFNGPVAPNDRANEYVMDELYLTIARPVDATRRELDLGFQIDLLYGSDGFFFESHGLEYEWYPDPLHAYYQLALPQFYTDLFVPVGKGLTVRAGHFYTVMGYELQL